MSGTTRREFLSQLGVTTVAAVGGTAAGVGLASAARAEEKPKGKIPDTPFKIGHMTFFTGAGAVLGEPMYKGNLLAADEINAQGGLLGKRKIEIIKADEAAGTDANTKEMRRMKLSEKIDMFMGITSSGNTPALGPVAEELKLLTIFVDGRTDVPKTLIYAKDDSHADDIVQVVREEFGKGNDFCQKITYRSSTARIVTKKLLPKAQGVSEAWPKLFSTDFTPHITKTLAAKPDLLVTSLWGGDYVAFYKQALQHGLFDKMKVATTLALGSAPQSIGKDHPDGVLSGVHSNYHFTYPAGDRWPLNKSFVEKYKAKFNEYPNFQAEGAYTATYVLKTAVEKANKLMGGWPDDDALISQIEGMMYAGPGGYVYIRPDNHQGYKDAITGFSKQVPEYPFPILDPNRIITIPIRNITAPPGWPKGEPTSTYTWIDKTWPSAKA